jgi:superfamily I DNA and/or RNA helicase
MESVARTVKTPSVWIHPNVQIVAVNKPMWNMNCRVIVVKLNVIQSSAINWSKRFFNGQMLCFTTSKDFNDLVVATVMNRDSMEKQPDEITIEIVLTENISDIFDKNLIMLEPTTFFEPYHKVFNVFKNLNEHNFPFKNQILNLNKEQKFPSYERPDRYNYKEFTFNLSDWPANQQLGLEAMQLKAIQIAITSEFTIIQGPPGTGKTFVGLEILKILLENTSETILILTQTNNALDKFLLGASKFTSCIARMGGQSKSEELEPFKAKSVTSFESKKYMKKLQMLHRAELSKLMDSDENNEEIYRKISTHQRLIEEIHQLSSFCSINDKRVIGMTTTFAARNSAINKMLKPGIVIIEEASEVLESHVLVSLTRETKQIIMIGDHQQLRPLTNSYELAKNFNFNISLFERLIRNDFSYVTLDVQRRMRSEICDLVRGTIYPSLKDGINVETYPDVNGMSRNFFCVNHSHPESVGDGETSKENPFEAEYAVKLCDHLIRNRNSPSQITILTAYAAQAQRIRRQLQDFPTCNVRVAVLDAYQGEESEIIILSLVRSNTRRDIGFLSTENRIAVVLSRAKFGLYIVANIECLSSASTTWRKIRDIMRDKHVIGDKIPGVEIGL